MFQVKNLKKDKMWDFEFFIRVFNNLRGKGVLRIDPDWLPTPTFIIRRMYGDELVEDCGKGMDVTSAWWSMIFEAIERSAAENAPNKGLLQGNYRELKDRFPLCNPAKFVAEKEGLEDVRLDWIKGTDLLTNNEIYVPCDCVFFPYNSKYFPTSTVGLAANKTKKRAILHAIFELLEHDTLSIYNHAGLQGREIEITLNDQPFYHIYQKLLQSGIDVSIKVMDNDVHIPVFVTYFEKIPKMPGLKVAGVGCHLNPSIALQRSMTECSQSAAYWYKRYQKMQMKEGEIYRPPLVVHDRYFTRKPPIRLRGLENQSTNDPDADLVKVLKRLGEVASYVMAVDITRELIPFPSIKVIIPDFEEFFSDKPAPGGRAVLAKKAVEKYIKMKNNQRKK